MRTRRSTAVRLIAIITLVLGSWPVFGLGKLQGYVERGNQPVLADLIGSSTSIVKAQRSYPGATVKVYNAGTSTLATIYSDRALTAKSNPFTASTTGYYSFYAADGRYDIEFSGSGIPTYTLADWTITSAGSSGTLNVMDFGAVCNGTTDDSAAFAIVAAAIPSSGNTVIYVPPTVGGCLLAGRSLATVFTISKSNVTIRGDGPGSWLKHSTTGATDSFATGIITVRQNGANIENIVIRDLRISGPAPYVGNQTAFHQYGVNILSGIHVGDSSSNTLTNVTIQNVIVEKVEGQGIGATGPSVYDGSGVHRLRVIDNIVQNTRGWGILVFGGTVYDTEIRGNTVTRVEGHAIESAGAGGNFITDNHVLGPSGNGIVVTGNNNAVLSPIHSNTISNNRIDDVGTPYWDGTTASMGILVNNESGSDVYYANVTGNHIRRAKGAGIVVSGHNGATVFGIDISNNLIQDIGDDQTQTTNTMGIRFADAAYTITSSRISNNRIVTTNSGFGMNYGIYVPAAVDFSAVDIDGNAIHSAVINAISVRSDPTDLRIGWNDHNGVWKFAGYTPVNFVILITNNAGTVQHSFRAASASTAAPAQGGSVIVGDTPTASNTPQVSAGVGFTAGAGVIAAATHTLLLNSTAAQIDDDNRAQVVIEFNSTGTALTPLYRCRTYNINGVSQSRPEISIQGIDGAAYPLTAANIPAGASIGIRVTEFIK